MDGKTLRILGGTAFFVTAMLTVPPARTAELCIQTRVTEAFVSPDGSIHQPGVVRICPYSRLSPAVRLARIVYDGRTLGVWMNRVGEAGRFADEGRTTIALRRLPQGRVALADYFWPGPDGKPKAPGLRPLASEAAVDGTKDFAAAFALQ